MWADFFILDPYSSHMALPMWVQHGTLLQIPHESLMGCPCRTHINTHLGPMWVLYFFACWANSPYQAPTYKGGQSHQEFLIFISLWSLACYAIQTVSLKTNIISKYSTIGHLLILKAPNKYQKTTFSNCFIIYPTISSLTDHSHDISGLIFPEK